MFIFVIFLPENVNFHLAKSILEANFVELKLK